MSGRTRVILLDEHRRHARAGGSSRLFQRADSCGDPVYNWDALRATGYRWSDRPAGALPGSLVVPIAWNFRGIPPSMARSSGRTNRLSRTMGEGPVTGLFEAVHQELGTCRHRRDLGIITPTCRRCVINSTAGARVLQFAFRRSFGQPISAAQLCQQHVAYTGTHDMRRLDNGTRIARVPAANL